MPIRKSLKDARVIVIGAGISGLAAARRLQDNGARVLVLEARDRVGGRIITDRSWGDIPMDLGAAWINGIPNNPVYRLAQRYGLASVETAYYAIPAIYAESVGRIPRAEREGAYQALTRIMMRLGRRRLRAFEDVPLRQAFDLARADMPFDGRAGLLEHLFHSYVEQEYAADGDDLSLKNWDDVGEYRGSDAILAQGLGEIPEKLAAGIDVRLGQAVTAVHRDGTGVTVRAGAENLKADYAVVSLPLGVLKGGRVAFSPDLPPRKRASIGRLAMGVMNKMFLRFPRKFWDSGNDWLECMTEQDPAGENPPWRVWFNAAKYVGHPVLVGFAVGSGQRDREASGDAEIVAEGMSVLRRMFGPGLPAPVAARVTRWGTDPYALGSYAHTPPGASGDDYDVLAEPVDGRLFFAGEATNRRHYGSIHGALLSGERAAGEIVAARRLRAGDARRRLPGAGPQIAP